MIKWVDSSRIDSIWTNVVPLLERALEHNMEYRQLHDVLKELRQERALLLEKGLYESVAVVKVDYPALVVELFGGKVFHDTDNEEWFTAFDDIAKQLGCTKIRLFGRKGWLKKLKKYDFNHVYTVMEKRVL